MGAHIMRCEKCSFYSLNNFCSCGGKTFSPKPMKFSPEDKYSRYRRQIKKEDLKRTGLL